MKLLSTFILFTTRIISLCALPVFAYGLMYLPFSTSFEEASFFIKAFVFCAGLYTGVMGTKYLTVIEKKPTPKLHVPDDVQQKILKLLNNKDRPLTLESVILDVIDNTWYNKDKLPSEKPEELALVALFLINQLNDERENYFSKK